MLALIGRNRARFPSAKMLIVAVLFALSLGLGLTTSTHGVEAKMVCYQDPGRGMVCTRIP